MLTLYNFGPGANSLKPLLALYEKGLDFKPHYLDPGKFEQHEDWYKQLNPNGQVPALDHDGKIITESTVICEYLEDVFTDAPPLRPADPYVRAQMRVWTKFVDEYFCWCVSTLGWERAIGPMARKYSDEEFEKLVERVPLHEMKVKWRTARKGFPKEVLEEEMRKIKYSVGKLEARLRDHEWLAGDDYSLADICNYAIATNMDAGYPEICNDKDTPGMVAWLGRIRERPAVKTMFANAPVGDMPGQRKAG
jgi:glutathione S-transferase